jgi:hypothetical protein
LTIYDLCPVAVCVIGIGNCCSIGIGKLGSSARVVVGLGEVADAGETACIVIGVCDGLSVGSGHGCFIACCIVYVGNGSAVRFGFGGKFASAVIGECGTSGQGIGLGNKSSSRIVGVCRGMVEGTAEINCRRGFQLKDGNDYYQTILTR